MILFLVLWVLTSRESGGRLNYYHTFLLLFVLKSRESRERLSCHHTVSITLGLQVTTKWRASALLQCFLYRFWYSSHEKVEDASAIIILFLMLWVLKSRESATRLSYYHTFSIALGTQVKRKWRTSQLFYTLSVALGTQAKRKSRTSQLLAYCFYYFGSLSHEKVKDVWAITMVFTWILVLKSRESGERLSYYHTFSNASGTQIKRK